MKQPNVAGTFYPERATRLKALVDDILKSIDSPVKKGVWGLIVPHAGYVYSGKIAGQAYHQATANKYSRVVILAPSHFHSFSGVATYSGRGFSSPLGDVSVDVPVLVDLVASNVVHYNDEAFTKEHSLEVQLPFVQEVIGAAPLVPLMMGAADVSVAKSLSVELKKYLENTLIIASTDMAHYNQSSINDAKDQQTISLIEAGDVQALYKSVISGESELCGLGPVMTMMFLAQELGSKIDILSHSNSGNITGDYGAVVGYLAAAYGF